MAKVLNLLFFVPTVLLSNATLVYEPKGLDQETQWMDCGLPNLSCRPLIDCRYVDVFGSALYWLTSQTATWALTKRVFGNSETVTYIPVSFDWAPGFRVGVGYNMEHDQWDTQIYYTWFATHTAGQIPSGSGNIEPGFVGSVIAAVGDFQTAQMSWKIHLNIFDWDLGRNFLVSKELRFRPFIGVKWGWINQTIHSRWQNPDFLFFNIFNILLSANENLKNNFFGGGPKGGVNGKWVLGNIRCHSFSFFGDFGAAYMWGNWKIRDKYIDSLLTTVTTTVGHRNFGSLVLQAMMGIGWDFNFSNDQTHFGLKLGYEIEDWFNHYQILTHPTGTHSNDLILQGLTADFRLDF